MYVCVPMNMYVYAFVCDMCVFIRVCMYICMSATGMCIRLWVCVCVCVCVHAHVCVDPYVCVFFYAYSTCVHFVLMFLCVHAYNHVCLFTCVCVCVVSYCMSSAV